MAIEETNETSPNLKSNELQNVRAVSEQRAMVTPEIMYLVLQMALSMTKQSNIDEMLTYQGLECEKKHKDLDEAN